MTAVPLSYLMGGVNQLLDVAGPLSYLMGGMNQLLDDCLAVWLERTGDDNKSSKGELLLQTLSRELLCTRSM
jgi:hypothetical protein